MGKIVLCGADRIPEFRDLFAGKRIGLMTNQTGRTRDGRSTIDILHGQFNLTALFACEHGIRGNAQAGESVSDERDAQTGLPVYSTYRSGGKLTEEMASQFDVFVFDMQDVGARFYTYLYSLSLAMETCAACGKEVAVLDRVNPLGGEKIEGTVLDEKFSSFVGEYALPTRTGFTVGEYALWVRDHLHLDLNLSVVPLLGWERKDMLCDLDIPWVAPSPNCRDFDTAICYVGTCIFEGTNLSEGRGTDTPFRLIGAPWLQSQELAERMNKRDLPGVRFRGQSFCPTFSKYAGETCNGVFLEVTDAYAYVPVLTGLVLLDEIRALHPNEFAFLVASESRPAAIDLLLGTDIYRIGKADGEELIMKSRRDIMTFEKSRNPFLLYK